MPLYSVFHSNALRVDSGRILCLSRFQKLLDRKIDMTEIDIDPAIIKNVGLCPLETCSFELPVAHDDKRAAKAWRNVTFRQVIEQVMATQIHDILKPRP
jgi:hypothetical protein